MLSSTRFTLAHTEDAACAANVEEDGLQQDSAVVWPGHTRPAIFEGMGRGMRATRNVPEGELLFSVPYSRFLTSLFDHHESLFSSQAR